jgi:Fe2+ or Zn2+ uptake regulation protein
MKDTKNKHVVLQGVMAASRPLRASRLQQRLQSMSLVEVLRLLNLMQREGSVEFIVVNEIVLWEATTESTKWLAKLEKEGAKYETPVDAGTSESGEGKAGDLRSDPDLPVPESSS